MTAAAAPLVLVDGSSYLFRAYHALPPLNNSKGQPTGAIKGVINMMRRLIKDYPQSTVVVIFDAKGKTFRDEIYSEYKANRPPMPDDLRCQIQPIHDIIRAMGLPLICIEGVEADDVIGTLGRIATEHSRDLVISTGDKDMAQLVNQHVTLVNTMTDTKMDVEGVKEKFGIPPELIIDFLALMGDKVDNIPGVPGVGEKTALGLLQGLGSIKEIYQRLDEVATLSFRGAKTMAKKLEANKEQAELSYLLATIKQDVELDFTLDELANTGPDQEALNTLFTEFEFKSWVKAAGAESTVSKAEAPTVLESADEVLTPSTPTHYETILDEASFNVWLQKLKAAKLFAFDTETTSLDYMQAQVVGVSFAVEPGSAAYVPFGHDYLGAPAQLARDWVLAQLKPLLEDANTPIVGQNLKYDANVLSNHGIDFKAFKYDTMLESYVSNSLGRHDMDTLALAHLGHANISFEEIAGKGAKQLTFNQIELDKAAPYAAEDADITLRLHLALWPKLETQPELLSVFNSIEMPLVNVLHSIERNGVLLDANVLNTHSQELTLRLAELQKEAFDLAGREFNLASPKQLGEIFFNELGLPVLKKTKGGAPSTAEEVLQELALDYPLPKLILEHRGLAKLKSTYTDKLPQMIAPDTGRVHTSYHQAVTATGRLSSNNPNLQNIPIKNTEGRRIRKAFIAPPGYKIVAADYSQIELRIMAHLSGDKTLLAAFNDGKDIHSATAAEVFGVALDDVQAEQRRSAKAINFGLIYGMSAFGLAKQLHIGRAEAQKYIDLYFERYPGVKNYMDNTRVDAAEKGYVQTLGGRRLYLPEINDRNGMRRQAAQRTAINAPMQGTAADIIKIAMITVNNWLAETNQPAKMIMQVHDELVFEVKEDAVETFKDEVCDLMGQAMTLDVPLLVEAGMGDNWDEAH
ncbi:DNA polymerase I [Marinagarivorans algicola]|uniref:DNA polymerase I n=1 Tax=Marinagarivorans algicola TaxID=1513270 RepID=UPI0006B4086C|nr:DNA polymerase I [Marinagarivorans algicola]